MKKIRISIYNAKSGMKLATDIFSVAGQMLMPADTELTDETIERLYAYSIPFITIYEESDEEVTPAPSSYTDRITNSPEFKQFQSDFNTSLGDVNQSLQHVVTSSDNIDVDDLLEQTSQLLTNTSNTIGVLDMINHLRSYDDSTFAHSLNVSIICNVFGQWLNMSKPDLEALTIAGYLHDLGKLLVPAEIIRKPGRLTEEEFNIIKQHPYLGYKHVENTNLDPRIKNAILMHHEKCDGSGYPSNLTLQQIDPFARIIAIADVYDAMTASRTYREGICPFHVIRMFEAEGYQNYDVQYLLPFLKGIIQSYINSYVRLTDGRVGKIIFINNHSLSRPIVNVNNVFVDLSTTPDLTIEEIL